MALNIKYTEFSKLPQKQQMGLLYQNTEEIKGLLNSYHIHRKIQYAWLSVLTIIALAIFKLKEGFVF